MHSHNIVNFINKPTRFPIGEQPGSPSILDHFYTNKPNKIKHVGILPFGSTDHYPVVAIISVKPKKIQVRNIYPYIRDFRNFDCDAFNESLINFTDVELLDLDSRIEAFHSHILSCLNRHIPLRKRTKRETKFALKPWISRALQKSIQVKKRLHTLSKQAHPDQRERE